MKSIKEEAQDSIEKINEVMKKKLYSTSLNQLMKTKLEFLYFLNSLDEEPKIPEYLNNNIEVLDC